MKTVAMTEFLIGGGGLTKLSAPLGGFTLAEVLITLGIIGVVAAMTMPTLMNSTQNRELESELKVAYSTIQQGLSRMTADRGNEVKPDDFLGQGSFYKEYKKYFNKIYDCSATAPNESVCMSRANAHGSEDGVYNDTTYTTYTGKKLFSNPFDDGQFVLPNGMLIMIENPGGGSNVYISVDVNGKRKKPNRLGHDVFTFQLMKDGKLLPMGAAGTVYTPEAYCKPNSSVNINGIACTYKALNDKAFWKNLPK